ncbi:MAG: single-stranded DNA-binding protein [Myxococcales bacterium]|nr:single-stranded DNA-binding protein [Myxococcales bacterium]
MLNQITDDLIRDLDGLPFGPPVTYVYNPLVYARAPWDVYCERYGVGPREVLLVGLNPGPFGMAQVGVPFGEVSMVRDWLRIEAPVGKPPLEHPKRPVLGFACRRSEVSGARLWGWARERFGTPAHFFRRFIVTNYCPLVFIEATGANRTPDKLPAAEREPLAAACDRALRRTIDHFQPRFVVGVGKFAEQRIRAVLAPVPAGVVVGSVPHPSPANPLANAGWAAQMDRALAGLGVA